MKESDWLNSFFEKNSWGILVAITGLIVLFTILKSQVEANTGDIKDLSAAMIQITMNQNEIVRLQSKQENMTDNIEEIKLDIKELLKR